MIQPKHIRIALALFCALPLISSQPATAAAAETDITTSIESFAEYLMRHWQRDPRLKGTMPPQIITGISAGSKVIGGCVSIANGRLSHEVGGTSYCPPTNTIFVVVDQLKPLYQAYGKVAIAYALAHEYGHYLQTRFKIEGDVVHSELLADCLAGAILGQGSAELGINQRDVADIAQTAYSIGDESHGSGDQRAYAVYTGLGQASELVCRMADIQKLARNEVKDPRFGRIQALRSGSGTPVTFAPVGPHLRTITGSLVP
jgi:hypothetical protein